MTLLLVPKGVTVNGQPCIYIRFLLYIFRYTDLLVENDEVADPDVAAPAVAVGDAVVVVLVSRAAHQEIVARRVDLHAVALVVDVPVIGCLEALGW